MGRGIDFRSGIDGAELNSELDRLWDVAKSIDGWRRLNQRDDGQVRDCRVGLHALAPDVFAHFGSTAPHTCPDEPVVPDAPDFSGTASGAYSSVVTGFAKLIDSVGVYNNDIFPPMSFELGDDPRKVYAHAEFNLDWNGWNSLETDQWGWSAFITLGGVKIGEASWTGKGYMTGTCHVFGVAEDVSGTLPLDFSLTVYEPSGSNPIVRQRSLFAMGIKP